jgi:hypothetical protein
MRFFQQVTLFLVTGLSGMVCADNPALAGRFAYVPERSAVISQAVDVVVAEMNVLVRPIARSRLNTTNFPYQSITFAMMNGKASITTDKRRPIVASVDGNPVKWMREDGEVMEVSLQWQGSALQETIAADDGRRVNVFEVSPDGRELRMRVTVSSHRLPKPLAYTLVYRRL